MMYKVLSVVAVVAALAGVNAQDATSSAPPTSTSGTSACIITCIATAAAQQGCTVTDINCLCTNTAVQQASLACLQSTCSSDEIAAAVAMQSQECAAVSRASSVSSAASTDVLPTNTPPQVTTFSGHTRGSPLLNSSSTNASPSVSVTESETVDPTPDETITSSSGSSSPPQPTVVTTAISSPSHRVSNIPTPAPTPDETITSSNISQTSSSGSSSPPQPTAVTTAISSPSHRVSSIPTPALAGAIASAVLATIAAAILLRLWMRRRRAHALLPKTQIDTSEASPSDLPSSPAVTDVRSRVFSKGPALAEDDDVPGAPTRTHAIVSGSSHSARYGSAASLVPSPSPQSLLTAYEDRKDHECHGQEPRSLPPPPPIPPLPEHLPEIPSDVYTTPEQETVEVEAHAGERLLHFALPWALGQRMLAMMAGEDRDAHSVASEGSEPLPAYEPRR